jgi:quinol monooxygenase YgiN
MHARVWKLRIRPGKLQELRNAIDSLIPPAQRQGGFRGVLVLGSGKKGSPDATVIALWDSLEAMRASEQDLLVTQAISRLLGCCEGFPRFEEREVLASEFFSSSLPSRAAGSARLI